MEKRKALIISTITIIMISIILTSPFLIWQAKPSKSLNVVILDKTVPDSTYREHKGFMWILNNLKITNGSKHTPFGYDENYYGFCPLPNKKYNIKELPESLGYPDLIYLADTYGVYKEDFYQKNDQGNRSEIIYGGVKSNEVDIIKNALDNNVIIGEFNTLASPTNNIVRTEMEKIFGLKWNGWIGRYFSSLSEENIEIPNWMKENYAMQYGVKWDFKGAGIVFVNSDDTIIVLRNEIELGSGFNTLKFIEKAKNEFKVKNNVNYYYWFEVTQANKDSEILANYEIDVTKEGEKILDHYNLPMEFPAIVRKSSGYTSYYFAGDFADSNVTPKVYCASGMRTLNMFTTIDEDTNQTYFYWSVYYPLIENILKNIK